MIGKAYFFRNVDNIDELIKVTKIAKMENVKMQRFRILEKVWLDKNDYLNFQKSFRKTHAFIKKITYKLTMSTDAEYLCVLVVSEEFKYGILVNSSGYSYARTIAMVEIGEDYGA